MTGDDTREAKSSCYYTLVFPLQASLHLVQLAVKFWRRAAFEWGRSISAPLPWMPPLLLQAQGMSPRPLHSALS